MKDKEKDSAKFALLHNMWAFSRTAFIRDPSDKWYGDKVRAFYWPEKDIEIEEEDIERELLSYFIPAIREYVIVKTTGDVIAASIPMCSKCDEPFVLCTCVCSREEMILNTAYIGYEAERMNNVKR